MFASPAAPRAGRARAHPPLLVLVLVLVLALAAALAGCVPTAAASPSAIPSPVPGAAGGTTPSTGPTGSITLYTSIQQPVVDAALAAFRGAQPGIDVQVFRAATGELSARMAAERRTGQIRGDVLWLTDPLSMHQWEAQGALAAWTPAGASAIDPAYRTAASWGTRILGMVIVTGAGRHPAPADWSDLTDPAMAGSVALPDPSFAGSAFAVLGYLAGEPAYGLDYYRRLAANGAVAVKSPDDVTSGVAEGRYGSGITLDASARAAVAKGSPVSVVWPSSGAISMASPVAVIAGSPDEPAARALVEFLLSPVGQAALGAAGQEPVLPGSGGPGAGGPRVFPDWSAAFGRADDLLEQYRQVFGG